MKSRTMITILIGLLLSAGCDAHIDPDNPAMLDHARFEPVALHGQVINASPVIGRPAEIRVSGQRLWIADAALDPSLHMLDMASGELLQSFGRKGEGPAELATLPQLHVAPGDTTGAIWTWDSELGRLTRFDPVTPVADPAITLFDLSPASAAAVPAAGIAWRVAWLEPDRLVGIHPSEDARFSLYAPSGALLTTIAGELLGSLEVPQSLRLRATVGGFYACAWPNRGFALFYLRTGRIEYYNRDARFVRLAEVPFPSDPFRKNAAGDFVIAEDREYYRSCDVHGDRLYAAFSGRLQSAYDSPANRAVEFIHVFDWQGTLTQIYRLLPEIHQIAVSMTGDAIYAASVSDGAIYRFPIHD